MQYFICSLNYKVSVESQADVVCVQLIYLVEIISFSLFVMDKSVS